MSELETIARFRSEIEFPTVEETNRARAALRTRFQDAELEPSGMPVPLPPPRKRWPLLLALAAAVALTALAILQPVATPTAAAELRKVAVVATARAPLPPLEPGQYYHWSEEGVHLMTMGSNPAFSALIPTSREYWIGADGSGRIVETAGEPNWPGPRDRARWETSGSPRLAESTDATFGPRTLAEEGGLGFASLPDGFDVRTLPRDPEALYRELRRAEAGRQRASGTSPDTESLDLGTFGFITSLVHSPLTPSEVRGSLFQAMAFIPGVEVDPTAMIPHLGAGAAVFLVRDFAGGVRVRSSLLFDPETSDLLGTQEVLLDPAWWVDAETPFVSDWVAYGAQAIVNARDERP
jgi:hypothetical protein